MPLIFDWVIPEAEHWRFALAAHLLEHRILDAIERLQAQKSEVGEVVH